MYLDRIFGLSLSLSEITLLFDLSLYLDRTLAQRKAKSKVSRPVFVRLTGQIRISYCDENAHLKCNDYLL